MKTGKLLLLSPRLFFADNFDYADSAALLVAWTVGGTTPTVTLQSAPNRLRVENGAAASAWAARSFVTQIGKPCLVTGNIIAHSAINARVQMGTAANGTTLGQYVMLTGVLGRFSLLITPTTALSFITINTQSSVLGQFVEVNDLRVVG